MSADCVAMMSIVNLSFGKSSGNLLFKWYFGILSCISTAILYISC